VGAYGTVMELSVWQAGDLPHHKSDAAAVSPEFSTVG